MAHYTSTQAGNWSNTATWGGSGPPGNGDTADVNHNVTVDTNTTVGTSPSGTKGDNSSWKVVGIFNSSSLIVESGNIFTVKGGIILSASTCTLEMKSGSSLIFSASEATDPTAQSYGISSLPANEPVTIAVSGNDTAHVSMSSDAGGGYASIHPLSSNRLRMSASYLDVLRFGNVNYADAGQQTSISPEPNNVDDWAWFSHCLFSSCSTVETADGGFQPYADYVMEYCTFTGSTADSFDIRLNNTEGGGTRLISGNVFDRQVNFTNGRFLNFVDNILYETTGVSPMAWGSSTGMGGVWRRNFIWSEAGTGENFRLDATYNNVEDTYILKYLIGSTGAFQLGDSVAVDTTFDGVIWELYETGSTSHDGYDISGTPASSKHVTFQNCIMMYDWIKERPSAHCFANYPSSPNANLTHSFNHNTIIIRGGEGIEIPSGQPNAGSIASLRSNIFFNHWSGSGGFVINNLGGTTYHDIVAGDNADYNCVYNLGTGSEVYNTPTTIDPGQNDLRNVNPNFFAPTRNIAAWDQSLGGPGTTDNAIYQLRRRNFSDWNPAYNIGDLISYVRAGYAPTNPLLAGAGHDGVTIGAVEATDQINSVTRSIAPAGGDYSTIISAEVGEAPFDLGTRQVLQVFAHSSGTWTQDEPLRFSKSGATGSFLDGDGVSWIRSKYNIPPGLIPSATDVITGDSSSMTATVAYVDHTGESMKFAISGTWGPGDWNNYSTEEFGATAGQVGNAVTTASILLVQAEGPARATWPLSGTEYRLWDDGNIASVGYFPDGPNVQLDGIVLGYKTTQTSYGSEQPMIRVGGAGTSPCSHSVIANCVLLWDYSASAPMLDGSIRGIDLRRAGQHWLINNLLILSSSTGQAPQNLQAILGTAQSNTIIGNSVFAFFESGSGTAQQLYDSENAAGTNMIINNIGWSPSPVIKCFESESGFQSSAESGYNFSLDNTATGPFSVSGSSSLPQFVSWDYNSGSIMSADLRLDPSDTVLQTKGRDLLNSSFPSASGPNGGCISISTDFFGQDRTGGLSWDIGFDHQNIDVRLDELPDTVVTIRASLPFKTRGTIRFKLS